VTGAAVVTAWIALGWDKSFLGGPGVYEILPGFVAAWIAIIAVSRATSTSPGAQPVTARD
jgi:SSS family solute:Na+ symporter